MKIFINIGFSLGGYNSLADQSQGVILVLVLLISCVDSYQNTSIQLYTAGCKN
jgi:hypothetical protein